MKYIVIILFGIFSLTNLQAQKVEEVIDDFIEEVGGAENWKNLQSISRFFSVPGDSYYKIYRAFPDKFRIDIRFEKAQSKMNVIDDDIIGSLLGKLLVYSMRFMTIIELLQVVCNIIDNSKEEMVDDTLKEFSHKAINGEYLISKETVEKSFKVIEYFEETGREVIDKLHDPVKELSPAKQAWYNSLPEYEVFKAEDAIKVGEGMDLKGLKKRSIQNLFRDPTLFKKVSTGYYERLH